MNPIYRGQYPPKNTNVLWIKDNQIYIYQNGGWTPSSASIDIDDTMVPNSINPVQSKVIQQALSNKQDKLTFDSNLSETSENPIKNNAVYEQYMTDDDTEIILEILGKVNKKNLPLTAEFIEAGTVNFPGIYDMQYSLNNGNWENVPYNGTLAVQAGDILSFKTTVNRTSQITSTGGLIKYGSPKYNLYGRLASIIIANWTPETEDYLPVNGNGGSYSVCKSLFSSSSVVSAKELVLMKTVGNDLYEMMFNYCRDLVEAPEFKEVSIDPSLGEGYQNADSCYMAMFGYCQSLQEAKQPKLTTLYNKCYQSMYMNCTALEEVDWDLEYSELTADSCYNNMFYGCTSLTKAPKILATSVTKPSSYAAYCENMFKNCSQLAAVTCLLPYFGNNWTYDWLSGTAASGTLTKNSAVETSSIPRNASGAPSNWTIVDNS